ncbi:AraC family transcriptional regulator [Salmonella enterica]|nr:AraC family transcriptional regulator [Salmonella enterica subsp. enterica serovar Enteritidis]EAQ5249030.1 AraC family transcriptional regulator [Salmonella enterica]EAS5451850.1 AraC family transcriptional regulator [Salmonella enterica]ECS7836031.1 AraC family transcriptional regulator [Salmonella enterica subsp. enterica serovar Enteritidis]EDB4970067.1 AraC family transcriptional regulator [Salmonella enterica subsp. enterica serovar Enteritidis]
MELDKYLLFFLAGGSTFNQGKAFSFRCAQDSIVLTKVHQTEMHFYRRYHHVVITRETLCRFARQLDVDVLKFYIPKDIPRYLVQPCPEDSVFCPLMVRLCAGTDNGHGETGPENPFLTFALVSAFCEQDIFFSFLKTCLKQSMADQVATVINRNVSENWTIHRVASELYVSVSLLKKKLKEENTSYTRILLECRMKKASELIVMQEGAVKKVAYQCGYSSVPYFISQFRKYYGYTPSRCRPDGNLF